MKKSKVISSERPDALVRHINGVHTFSWDIEETVREDVVMDDDGNENVVESPQFEYYQVDVADANPDKVIAAAIDYLWGNGKEAKLVNDYNAAVTKVITGDEATAAKAAYKEFLSERAALKAAVDDAYSKK